MGEKFIPNQFYREKKKTLDTFLLADIIDKMKKEAFIIIKIMIMITIIIIIIMIIIIIII